MERKLVTFISWLLFLQMDPSLTAPQTLQMWRKVEEKVLMPCNKNGAFRWRRNGLDYARMLGSQIVYGIGVDSSRISFPHGPNNSMQLTNLNMGDAGTYFCDAEEKLTINLVIFQISALPSANLIVSENLVLSIESSPKSIPGLRVSWETPNRGKSEEKSELTVANAQIRDSGTYSCHVWIDGGNKATFTQYISVSGFYPTSEKIYVSKDSPALIPWLFNFNVRETALINTVSAVNGSISYSAGKGTSPSLISSLTVTSGACWPQRCEKSQGKEQLGNLSFVLPKPKAGRYHLEIQLKLGDRKKMLAMDVCLVMLTVSVLPRLQLPLEAKATLSCHASCSDANSTLYWQHENSNSVMHGQRGEPTFSQDLTAVPESMGVWSCSVRVGGKTMMSTNLTLELEATFMSSPGFVWVLIGGGAVLFLVGIVTIVIVTARCRQKRRARRGAWILQNLHQQRTCQCKGFAPTRLREKD